MYYNQQYVHFNTLTVSHRRGFFFTEVGFLRYLQILIQKVKNIHLHYLLSVSLVLFLTHKAI